MVVFVRPFVGTVREIVCVCEAVFPRVFNSEPLCVRAHQIMPARRCLCFIKNCWFVVHRRFCFCNHSWCPTTPKSQLRNPLGISSGGRLEAKPRSTISELNSRTKQALCLEMVCRTLSFNSKCIQVSLVKVPGALGV